MPLIGNSRLKKVGKFCAIFRYLWKWSAHCNIVNAVFCCGFHVLQ